ncbi:MAG: response regulator [Caldimonas sp.]
MIDEMSAVNARAILVVDDSYDDFDTVLMAARRANVRNRIVHAADADAAQRLISDGTVPFAFMLLDYDMPGVDGLGFLQRLRKDSIGGKLPTIVFTASVNPRDRDAFYDAGANAYHVKTVRFEDCLDTLEHIFHYWLRHAALPDVDRDAAGAGRH